MKEFLIKPILNITLILTTANAIAADVSIGETPWKAPTIHIKGEIENGDFKKIVPMFKQVLKSGHKIIVSLDSSGGSFIEAIKIGELIKKLNAHTYIKIVVSNTTDEIFTKCYSACFIIFVSGSSRDNGGVNRLLDKTGTKIIKEVSPLGIHRPYIAPREFSKLSPYQAKLAYTDLEAVTRRYLTDLSIPAEIIDIMFRTASDDMYIVGAEEFSIKIGYKQPFYEEWEISLCKKLSKKEFD